MDVAISLLHRTRFRAWGGSWVRAERAEDGMDGFQDRTKKTRNRKNLCRKKGPGAWHVRC